LSWGLIAGYLAGYVRKDGGDGVIGDIAIEVLGSLVGSDLFRVLGVSPGAGLGASVAVAFSGAIALLFAQHQFWSTHA
jgi:uncharacterized membrane protein YeaQ/YmgE (transglycosylase-associated protein family)